MFIIDFDDTLFDTQALKQARLDALKEIGISEEVYWETYKQAHCDSEGNFVYTDRRHAQFLAVFGFDENKIVEKFSKVSAKLYKFLFPDTVDFLESLKKYNQPIILLSLGDPNFQEFKLEGARIREYFNHIFMVSEPKYKALSDIFKFENASNVWFINDKVEETKDLVGKFSVLKPVLKVSKSINFEEYLNSGLPYFKTLTEIKDYVSESI